MLLYCVLFNVILLLYYIALFFITYLVIRCYILLYFIGCNHVLNYSIYITILYYIILRYATLLYYIV
jgi:hypothetical protein